MSFYDKAHALFLLMVCEIEILWECCIKNLLKNLYTYLHNIG